MLQLLILINIANQFYQIFNFFYVVVVELLCQKVLFFVMNVRNSNFKF